MARVTVSGKRGQHGFTLIELLVVIVILGILSGVVVFAVRSAGDKGSTAAIAADARTIRTAEEAYCAKHGKYVDVGTAARPGTLVGDRFLSEPSKYHMVQLLPEGPCNGGYRLILLPCGTSGHWCRVDPPLGNIGWNDHHQMVELPGGKVLAAGEVLYDQPPEVVAGMVSTKAQLTWLYDPGAVEPWTDGPSVRIAGAEGHEAVNDMIVLRGSSDPGCHGCGKVLAHVAGHPSGYWTLYDPREGKWEPILPPSTIGRDTGARAVQLLDHCGEHCGKVLIVGGAVPRAEFYDPETNQFELIDQYSEIPLEKTRKYQSDYIQLIPLKDGKVLVFDAVTDEGKNEVWLFDPKADSNGAFQTEASPGDLSPPAKYRSDHRPQLLPDGRVLFSQRTVAHLYSPNAPERWTPVDSCATPEKPHCNLLATLPDGQVLAHRSDQNRSHPDTSSLDTALFDIEELSDTNPGWNDTAGLLNDARSAGHTVALSSINRILSVGHRVQSAELYTP